MSDEDEPEEPPVPQIEPTAFPNGHLFPNELLEQWVQIPATDPLVLGALTRGDIDNLLFSFRDVTFAIASLRQGLIEYSHGRLDHANAHLQNALNRNIDAENRNRLLFEAIMKSAIEARKYAGK